MVKLFGFLMSGAICCTLAGCGYRDLSTPEMAFLSYSQGLVRGDFRVYKASVTGTYGNAVVARDSEEFRKYIVSEKGMKDRAFLAGCNILTVTWHSVGTGAVTVEGKDTEGKRKEESFIVVRSDEDGRWRVAQPVDFE